MLLKYYEYSEVSPEVELFIQQMNEIKFRYYASKLLKNLLHSKYKSKNIGTTAEPTPFGEFERYAIPSSSSGQYAISAL